MLKLKGKKSGFTLAEIIVVCSIFAVIVVGMIFGISRAFVFLNSIRLQVMATNFAREGVEMMYNMRDSNRRKCAGDRDYTRLYRGGNKKCENISSNDLLVPGIYIINEETTTGADSYVYTEFLTGNTAIYNLEGFFDEDNSSYRERSKLLFTGSYSYNSGGTIVTGSMNELMEGFGTEFYRLVRVYGIQEKINGNVYTGQGGYTVNNGTPAELRFCVMVFYTDNRSRHEKELCSIMTNFLK